MLPRCWPLRSSSPADGQLEIGGVRTQLRFPDLIPCFHSFVAAVTGDLKL